MVGRFDLFYCDKPKAQKALTFIYFVVFTIVTAMVVMSLFIGVITTNMEGATEEMVFRREVEQKVQKLVDAPNALTPGNIQVYRKVFALLDINQNNTVDLEELYAGLMKAGDVTREELTELIDKVDEEQTVKIRLNKSRATDAIG